jgi:predicted pyridoxine 5'-phosphate oxidase superfamily flavin-nucleotide-binding protein
VGLLFFIPGVGDTFRVNGRATLTTDPALLRGCAVEGKVPRLGILVDVEQAFTHCSKALLRSDFWNPARFVERSALPTNGAIHKELAGGDFDAEEYDRARAERYAKREGFY